MSIGPTKRTLKLSLLVAAMFAFAVSCLDNSKRITPEITSAETPPPVPLKVSDTTFRAFAHDVPEHAEFDCNSCHRREGKSLDMEFPGHESCIGCHLNQFTETGDTPAMCAICHDNLQVSPPTMKEFPREFNEGFNMKFSHAAHDSGEGRPPAGCASCHLPAGAGKTIPVGFRAHNNCYACHTPEKEIGQCSTCHALAPYRRTPPSRYVFRAVFTHNDHTSVGCGDCHNVIAGAPQGRQVTSIVASEHDGPGNNCYTCHNGVRAFGGNGPNDFANCARCHKGSGFDMLPGT